MARSSRQNKILEIIASDIVETQEDLVTKLHQVGLNVTQATVSRDIKELGLIKRLDEASSKYKYVFIDHDDNRVNSKAINVFKHLVKSIDSANNLVVIRTLTGSANAAAEVIDNLNNQNILGSIAGDDTILLILRTTEAVPEILKVLNNFLD